jgi:hypothetical protein
MWATARPLPHEWHSKAAIWPTEANRRAASPTYEGPPNSRRAKPSAPLDNAGAKGTALQITELVEPMSADEMIECLGTRRARWEIAAMIKALSLHPRLNTSVEAKRLEAARAAMENWKSYSHACQARHNAHRLRLGHR